MLASAALAGLLGMAPAGAAAVELPDHRAYELVTSAPKTELFVGPSGWEAAATPDGEQVAMTGYGALGEPPELFAGHPYLLSRGSSGWSTQSLVPPHLDPTEKPSIEIASYFTDDAKAILTTTHQWAPGDIDGTGVLGGYDLYEVTPGQDSATWLTGGPLNAESKEYLQLLDATPDGQHVLFDSVSPLVEADTGRTGGFGLYESFNGQVRLVGVDNQGALLSSEEIREGGWATSANGISRDGSTIFFSIASGGLYARVNGIETLPIPSAGHNLSSYAGASADGSVVFFTTVEQLTPDDVDSSPDLYAYNLRTHSLIRITAGPSGNAENTEPFGPVVASEDGSRVYFTAFGQLIPGKGAPGERNLYLYDRGTYRYIGPMGSAALGGQSSHCNQTRVTADGEHLLFSSSAQATPDDTNTEVDLFLYNAVTQQLRRVTKGPTGEGGGDIGTDIVNCTSSPGNGEQKATHPLTADGDHVFFDSAKSLVPADQNGRVDVYEYDATTDRTSLISSGTSPNDSYYLDSSENGSDVFFVTSDQLVPQDGDFSFDYYDARVNGGFPAEAAPPCRGEGCRGLPSAPPEFSTPGSVTLTGVGNLAASAKRPAVKKASRGRRLAKALKRCRKKRSKSRRKRCEAQARKRYGRGK